MLNIVSYSFQYDPWILERMPYIHRFAERGLPHLAELRDPDTRIVFLSLRPVDPLVVGYHLRDVLGMTPSEERSALRRLRILRPAAYEGESDLAAAVLADETMVSRLRALVAAAGSARLSVFTADSSLDRLGRILGVAPSERPAELTGSLGSKAGSKAVFDVAGVPSPRGGRQVLRSVPELARAARRLALEADGVQRLMLKLDSPAWGSGLGNISIDVSRLLACGSLPTSVEVSSQSWAEFAAHIPGSGAIIEEYIPGVVRSLSCIATVQPDRTVRSGPVYEQLLAPGYQYAGASFGSLGTVGQRGAEAARKVGSALCARGYRGSFGLDLVERGNGELLAVEINLRKVASSHPVGYVEAATRAHFDEDGNLLLHGEQVRYVFRQVLSPRLAGLSPAEAIGALRERGLLYEPGDRQGALLHLLGALRPYGYVEVTCVGASEAVASNLVDRCIDVLYDAADRTAGIRAHSL
ncbi:peptide ligase PGM1-related protein [Streptomyces sp. NPDC001351]|uniref:peptide ligase PGM1-related protein n=1 Tax=Streptomyces sp. NPDC001351 TaxID=3364564 RepID=UPI0036A37416